MSENIKISKALISVSDKTGIIEFAKFLNEQGVEIISTGGTAKSLRENNIEVKDISEITNFPEIMDGRVKTLHPKVHGGLLAVRKNSQHKLAMEENEIQPIDLVVVNLYPFEETVKKGAGFDEVIENIDIGGPSMIRSAAKNHQYVTIVVNPNRYKEVIEEIKNNNGATSPTIRKSLASEAFSRTAFYDSAISNWFSKELEENFSSNLSINARKQNELRYGENPHQSAALYISDKDRVSVCNAKQLQGKELSYNNILDADSAFELVNEFEENACVIVKHNNPCGVAISKKQIDAYIKALNCDPISAFGGIHAFNREVDGDVAEEISKIFSEVIIAPKFSDSAIEILSKKKNLRLLETGTFDKSNSHKDRVVKSISGGFLLQDKDDIVLNEDELKVVTKRKPTDAEIKDLKLAFTICKHVKSNAIIYVKDGATVGIGAGQMSRIDSSKIGAAKAKDTNKNSESAEGSVLASDAFFPFADGIEAAIADGITAVIQPGGSVRDDEVIAAADKAGIAMIFTGIRHFKH